MKREVHAPQHESSDASQSTKALVVDNLFKSYGSTVAARGVSIEVEAREFFSILGPSGSGKTTVLRAVGGFLQPDSGRILIRGEDVSRVPPYRRPCNMVFQNYALFPHLSVSDNLAFGLVERKVRKPLIAERVEDMLRLVRLEGYGNRRSTQLSGGQQQRVALGRALINDPAVLLLDEPLGALDAKLRKEMQLELKRIQREIEMTFVYVTHDQDEALTMSDRVAIMNDGQVEQVGSPTEIYETPHSLFVARFVGEGALLDGVVMLKRPDGALDIKLENEQVVSVGRRGEWVAGDRITVLLRPEHVRIATGSERPARDALKGRVTGTLFHGSAIRFAVETGGIVLEALVPRMGAPAAAEGDEVWVYWQPEAGTLLRRD